MKGIKNNKAYSLIEFMIVISVLVFISSAAFSGLNAIRKNHAIEEDEAGIDIREISKQEFLLQGLKCEEELANPLKEYGDVDYKIEETNSDLNVPGKTDIALLGVNFDADRERVKVVGKVIKDSGLPQKFQESTLLPPIVNVSGIVNLSKFPIKKLIIGASNNPLGTYYRYTTDGSDPVLDSKVWTFPALSLSNWAPIMKFRAFHSEDRYKESAVLEVITAVTGNVVLQREDGKGSTEVSYSEIVNGTNRLVLKVLGGDSSAQIRYRVRGGSGGSGSGEDSNINYTGPFHFPVNTWDSSGLTFIAEVKIPQCSKPIGTQEFALQIKKEPLAKPEIIADCESGCSSGTKVGIKVDRTIASTVTAVEGQDAVYYLELEDL